ncbi:group I truncated hemoglobin [Hyphococcus sp.]|uniref:group I truncated hemoglobin n=1 Tax=Hyphococcus sp. TaxID=2038636 RepID=UPI003CCC2095
MNIRTLVITLAVSLMLSDAASAEDDRLYRAFGGKDGIARIVEDFTSMALDDPRVSATFDETSIPRFKEKLTLQLCELTGGPCVYDGLDMHAAHSGLDMTTADFNAIVEILQNAMNNHNIPFRTQNKLLKLLAPMKRDIVVE